jgi:type II secretory pathway pseudopilin PulG
MLDRPRLPRRGSTLIIVVILLAVLAVLAVGAVRLSMGERSNASAKGTRDRMYACANAARVAVWSELAKYGQGYFASTDLPSSIALPDGTTLTAPAHYSVDMNATMQVKDVVVKNPIGCPKTSARGDLTNTFRSVRSDCNSDAYSIVARCTDGKGNELEVEFVTALAL